MTELFLTVLNRGISAGWLVLALLVLRLVVRRAPRWMFPLFWGLVALRLLLPFSIESALSLLPSAEAVSPSIVTDSVPAIQSGVPLVNSAVNPVLGEALAPDPAASANPAQVLTSVFAAVWAAGVLAMLCYLAVSWLRVSLRLRTAVLVRGNIFRSEWARTPFLFGVVRPRIILPFSLPEEDAAFVVAHEQAHLARRDHWVKPLAFLLLSVFWFHPLLWLAWILLCRDIELACDERVVRGLSREERAGYSEALLHCSVREKGRLACPLAFGEAGVRERVKAALSYRKPAVWVIALAAVLGVSVAVCFLTNPQTRESMAWARSLSAGSVERVELVVMPQAQDKQYRVFTGDEVNDVVALINESRGSYVAKPEAYDGGSIQFTVTMDGGETHTVSNIGNVYLEIDGDFYDAGYEWLSSWDSAYGAGNEPLPETFLADASGGKEPWMWVDLFEGDSLDITTKLETELPEFPGVLFHYSAYELTALEDGETITLYKGMPIWNVYLADLNGDGKRELCSSAAFGSGLIDNRIEVYDYANGVSYELADRGETDYGLVLENGVLCATMTSSSIASEEKADRIGRLVLAKENGETSLRIEDERPYETEDASSASDEPAGTQDAQAPDLDAAIASAVLAQFAGEKPDGLIHVESHAILEQQELSPTPLVGEDPQPNQLTVYLWTLAQSFRAEGGALSEVSGVSQPAALTFELGADGYTLTDYWTPRDGSAYLPDLRARFPESALELAQAYEGNTESLAAANLEKAQRALEETGGADVLVERLLDDIVSQPLADSSPAAYIEASPEEYDELLSLGEEALRVCFARFLAGGQTDLKGAVRACLCRELIARWGEEAGEAENGDGQSWFDAFYARALELRAAHSQEELEKRYPASWLLLSLAEGGAS